MSEENIQNFIISNYNENMEYLKNHHVELYNSISLFDVAIELNQLSQNFDLEFKNEYFDLKNLTTNEYFYNGNSLTISNEMIETQVDFIPTNNSFKAFYNQTYTDEIANDSIAKPIDEINAMGNAPIIHYVNKNLPLDAKLNSIYKFMIFGVGLGVHIPLIHEKIKSKLYLIVEPNLETFRLSLFVTNYAKLEKEARIIFSICEDEIQFKKKFDTFYCDSFIDNHFLKFFGLTNNYSIYTRIVQNYLISQGHYLYSYDRTFLSIFRTNKYITNDYKILNISKFIPLEFTKKPILLLAAGPSLQKQIDFVKHNQEKFIIVAIYATLPLLEKNNIKPDIITQYDEQNHQVLNTLNRIKDINFFKDSILLIASHVNEKLTKKFPKNNIYIFQAMFELKKDFGTLTSPSIGELTFALVLKLGAKKIYLLGLDLALDNETNKTHIDGHSGALNNIKEIELSSDNTFSYRKNTILVKGNFLPEVKTLPVFKSNIDSFNMISEEFKTPDTNVYNLSDGAYFNKTIPTKIESLNLEQFINLKKDLNSYKKELDIYCDINYNDKDLELINLKISSAKKFKNSLEKFYKIKSFNSFDDYKNKIFFLLNELLFSTSNAKDLQSIITNYCQHNLHYVFHLFNTQEIKNLNKHIKNTNEILFVQLSKIINEYIICITYSDSNDRAITKKLNKFLKEYSITNTIYSELFFKEIVESSEYGEHNNYQKNSIGFFATTENLTNKSFVTYIKNLYTRFPQINFKIFYFFEYQKQQIEYSLKSIKNRSEIILPRNINDIANEVEIWMESYNLTYNVKKMSDILLNNYKNINSIFFKNESYNLEFEKFSEKNLLLKEDSTLKDIIEENYFIPNSSYYKFCETFKYEINFDKLNSSYKKNHVGFFGFEENLTKYLIKNIYEMANNFPELNFVCFYFEEREKIQCQKVFSNILDRVNFICPENIYDVAHNIETWVQSSIKNQSFLFNKIYNIFEIYSGYIYFIIFNEYTYKWEKEFYLENMYDNFSEISFIKSFSIDIEEKINKVNYVNNIGFVSTTYNLNDEKFIKLITILLKKIPYAKFKVFYFSIEEKDLASNLFRNEIERFEFIIPKNLKKITSEISSFISSSTNAESIVSYKIWKKLNQIKANLFLIDLCKEINDEHSYSDSLELTDNSELFFENSLVSEIFKNNKRYDDYLFLNSINRYSISQNNFSIENRPNNIGFLATKENIEDENFISFLRTVQTRFKNTTFIGFYLDNYEPTLDIQGINLKRIVSIMEIIIYTKILIINFSHLIDNKIASSTKGLNIFIIEYYDLYSLNRNLLENSCEWCLKLILNNYKKFGLDLTKIKDKKNHLLIYLEFILKDSKSLPNYSILLDDKQSLKECYLNLINLVFEDSNMMKNAILYRSLWNNIVNEYS